VSGIGITPLFPFELRSGVPYYTQIYNGYRDAIISGKLAPGQRLPSSRTLAEELQVSRFPVVAAFEQLREDGYLVGVVGSGTFIRDPIPEDGQPITGSEPTPPRVIDAAQIPSTGDDRRIDDKLGLFAVGVPALDQFPRRIFSRLLRHHAVACPAGLLGYGDPAGYPPLRQAIADYLRPVRAVDCDADQVLVVPGSQMGLVISALALTTPESCVCIEEPGYPGLRHLLALAGVTAVPVAVDDDGIDVAAIRRIPFPVKAVFVTPSHQFPLGVSLEVVRRMELLSWAARHDVWIVENDHGSEFHYSSRPLGALQGMDADARVIYVGTFSQALFPALRLGYMVVPRALSGELVRIREGLDICSPILHQLALTDFLTQGHFARHLHRMRFVYRARRDALITAVRDHAADVLTIGNVAAGMHLVAALPSGVDDQEVVRRAGENGMYPKALSACYATAESRTGLLLGFGGSEEHALTDGVRVLAEIIRGLPHTRSRELSAVTIGRH